MKPLTEEEQVALTSTDGAQWILEERRGDKYWTTQVQSPQMLQKLRGQEDFDLGFEIPNFEPYIECCLYFLQLAGVHEQEIY
ncbi:MAG: hypothetical protein EOP84_32395 [Verrucomicrobiaceae bacterium]|nr:MAG: hypothetical protein EOP84_32395 [Verrucomicrobiaceae bacterium]